ncbi:MAG: hypothetical protein ACWGSQ_15445 [Longimicrobiales bacterium]
MVWRARCRRLGPFRDGIRTYLETFAFGNATWPALIEILDRISPEDLRAWSDVWVEEPGRPTVWAELEPGAGGTLASLTLRQADPAGEGRVWPQPLSVALGYGREVERFSVRLTEGAAEIEGAAGRDLPDYVLPDGWGEGYGLFLLDQRTRDFLLTHLPEVSDPVVRGAGWLALWDGVLEGDVPPGPYLDLVLRSLPLEEEEQILQRILGNLEVLFWTLIPESERAARAPGVEDRLWEGVSSSATASRKSSFFQAYRSMALTPGALGVLEEIWRGEREIPSLTLSESDRMVLASAMALREVEDWARILDTQLVSIENPDRREEFEFLRPSLDADPLVREAFFERLKDPANREKEPWVLAGIANLHHPLRRNHGLRFIQPSLELLEEVQRTGDIFFPARWIATTLRSHNSPEAAAVVRAFLDSRPDYPHQLRLKVLQAADPLFRAAEILPGGGS